MGVVLQCPSLPKGTVLTGTAQLSALKIKVVARMKPQHTGGGGGGGGGGAQHNGPFIYFLFYLPPHICSAAFGITICSVSVALISLSAPESISTNLFGSPPRLRKKEKENTGGGR